MSIRQEHSGRINKTERCHRGASDHQPTAQPVHKAAAGDALGLPTFEAGGMTLLKRCTLVVDDGRVAHVFYPVFPPDRNASEVIAWLAASPRSSPGMR